MFKKKMLLTVASVFLFAGVTMAKDFIEYKDLDDNEKMILERKSTEQAFSGKYWNSFEDGVYLCRRCGNLLYDSRDKFQSDCGWPSFDDMITGSVNRIPDRAGKRVEIVCARCGGHLGHVFEGEKLTSKDVRYCVNSLSLYFVPRLEYEKTAIAYFAGGCFWGLEYWFELAPGVVSVESGYMGGEMPDPTYTDVQGGKTGHAETVKVVFRPAVIDYERLTRLFFEIHDPTQVDRQGPDIGSQYRSVIFAVGRGQADIAAGIVKELNKKGIKPVTRIKYASGFFPAEEYHQDYYLKNGKKPYCHFRVKRF